MANKNRRTKEEEVLIWAGVVAQLNRTRSNQLLRDAAIPYPLFVLLRHFSHDIEREWTISSLTAAFETGQSGMTKKVQKLLSLNLLNSRPDKLDGRKKWLRINKRGLAMLGTLNEALRDDQQHIFESWDKKDLEVLHRLLFQLKSYLDDNRQ